MCIFIENYAEFPIAVEDFETKQSSHSSTSGLVYFWGEKCLLFPAVNNEVDFIQFNIHSL